MLLLGSAEKCDIINKSGPRPAGFQSHFNNCSWYDCETGIKLFLCDIKKMLKSFKFNFLHPQKLKDELIIKIVATPVS